MNIRERIEEREDMILSPYAARSSMALRDIDEEPDATTYRISTGSG